MHSQPFYREIHAKSKRCVLSTPKIRRGNKINVKLWVAVVECGSSRAWGKVWVHWCDPTVGGHYLVGLRTWGRLAEGDLHWSKTGRWEVYTSGGGRLLRDNLDTLEYLNANAQGVWTQRSHSNDDNNESNARRALFTATAATVLITHSRS